MMMLQAATTLRDTVLVSMRESGGTPSWLVTMLTATIVGSVAWSFARSVDHGQRIQKIETFTGVDNEGGLSGKIDESNTLIHKLTDAVQAVSLDVAILRERSTPQMRTGGG
jgi:hypothetical protein